MKTMWYKVVTLIVIQGAFQELKLYGSPSQAEVQCVNTFEVRIIFIIYSYYKAHCQNGAAKSCISTTINTFLRLRVSDASQLKFEPHGFQEQQPFNTDY